VIFLETKLPGVRVIEPERCEDERGFFARTYCQKEFAAQGVPTELAQCNLSFNRKRGTLRGMHFQTPPREEAKLVRCTMGALYDVVLDLRPDSPTYTQWISVELTAENRRMLFIPKGCAHGFQTLEDNTEVFYQMSAFYAPSCAAGIRWNDPVFQIDWPLPNPILSARDAGFPDFSV
jgi:dTDP-4-dehydrorhamnose 3,5-epimerase